VTEVGAVSAGGITVETAGAVLLAARGPYIEDVLADDFATRLAGADPTLWGPEAAAEASIRLGWLSAHERSRDLLPRLAVLREQLAAEGIDHVVLAGMGGSSLAPEVITGSAGAELTVLDTTDPGQVRASLADRLERTVVVVSSKSGGTVETDSHRRAYLQAFLDLGLSEGKAGSRFVVVTDPGSPLEAAGREMGAREIFLADPDVGGRYSALTAFGLVPSALAGVDVTALLDDAARLAPTLSGRDGNPALVLGAALGGAGVGGHDKVVLAAVDSAMAGFGDWAEQLIAESTGKDGKGLLPVVVEGPDAPGFTPAGDAHLVTVGGPPASPAGTAVTGPLGAQFLAWEYATAVAGRILRINPFDQPNVTESKDNTKALLDSAGDGALPTGSPIFIDDAVEVFADRQLLAGATDLAGALAALLAAVPPAGYLAVMAYLDRHADAGAAGLRSALAARLAHPVTFGWGPRFLHSTGQFHKGGPQVGAFLQVTGAVTEDLDVPGRPYTFGRLQAAQALGDVQALLGRDRPVLHLHLRDRARGLAALLKAAKEVR
jgi:glucose-6-phosphate isomerase